MTYTWLIGFFFYICGQDIPHHRKTPYLFIAAEGDVFLGGSFLLNSSSILVFLLFMTLTQIKSQPLQDGREFFKTRIHVCHHGLAFSNLHFSWMLLSAGPGSLSPRAFFEFTNSFFKILKKNLFYPFSICIIFFCLHILHQNCFVSIASSGEFVFAHALQTCL